ncbi:MAG: PHP domain-containing protein, partial [Chloroflexi bacterium]|nr:PHP domain-containing protein [Chloroflexota bacterium]
MKVDLHVHTTYSGDSLTSLTEVVRWARRRDLGAVAITDHDTIEGAVALSKSAEIPVIVGEEVCTQSGEICGLFLREAIPSG